MRRAEAAAVADPANLRHALRAAAAIVRLEGAAAVSYESAASLWGLPVLGRRDEMHASRPRRCQGTTRTYPDLVLHHAALPREHSDRVSGVPVTSAARTVVDIARARSFRAGVVVADAALRLRRCTREELHLVARYCVRWPGSRRARQVIDFADDRSESPLESISRVAFHEWGLPAPSLQVWITEGECVDFLWARQRVIGEADGVLKYRTPQDLWNEKARQERLVELGYVFTRWAWREVFWRPDALAHRIGQGTLAQIMKVVGNLRGRSLHTDHAGPRPAPAQRLAGKSRAAATVCDRPQVLLEVLCDRALTMAGRINRSRRYGGTVH